jgi:hypothetical protein
MPIKDLLIVACTEHWQQCKLLLDSIDYYLTGYKIIVVDNSPQWSSLSHSMTNNHLQICPWQDFIPQRVIATTTYGDVDRGWVSQQLIKLAGYKVFKGDYVCLDTSNVVLSSFENSDWPVDRWAAVPDQSHDFYEFYSATTQLLGVEHLPVLPAQTPFILNSDHVRRLVALWPSWENFEQWFTSFDRPSEFWLYDLWMQKCGISTHLVSDHYIQQPLLCFYDCANWKEITNKKLDTSYFTVANVKRFLWEDPEFSALIAKKGINFLKP